MEIAIISVSDVSNKLGKKAWDILRKHLKRHDLNLAHETTVESERPFVAGEILRCCDERSLDVVLTIGGTGLGTNDIVPEATQDVCTRDIPGIAAAMRSTSKPSILSRHVSMQRGTTLVINLPADSFEMQYCLYQLVRFLPDAVESAHS